MGLVDRLRAGNLLDRCVLAIFQHVPPGATDAIVSDRLDRAARGSSEQELIPRKLISKRKSGP